MNKRNVFIVTIFYTLYFNFILLNVGPLWTFTFDEAQPLSCLISISL